jgi:hypothetical protein
MIGYVSLELVLLNVVYYQRESTEVEFGVPDLLAANHSDWLVF